ncbi:SAE2-domain-containing protein [Trichocladium antarcticum]|uniref:SAE2-domain-containing protein n=1 Tax=Trichocladium antarcticum TaxID=1450529 RepID=A0AAN6UTV5_9PEZI|nr:SAE2-domain-containing protein [Trichocladium antarcticum]
MDFWSHTGRPKLIAALERACDAVQEDLAAGFRQSKDAVAKADRLEKENRALRRELEALRKKHIPAASDNGPCTARPAFAEIPTNSKARGPLKAGHAEKLNSENEYSKLRKLNAAMAMRYKELQRVARKYRGSRDDWQKYAISVEGKVKRLEKKLQPPQGTGGLPATPSTACKPAPAGIDKNNPVSGRKAIGSSAMPNPESDTGPGMPEDAARQSTGHRGASPTRATTMPQFRVDEETDDEAEQAYVLPLIPPDMAAGPVTTIKEEPSSDCPVIVSERSLRKRKHTVDDPGTSGRPRRIKGEHSISSDPVEIATFCPHESIDLDEDQDGMPTPRKQPLRENRALTPREDKVPLELLHTGTRPGNGVDDTTTPILGTTPGRPTPAGLSTHKPGTSNRGSRLSTRREWNLNSAIADIAEDTFEEFHSPIPAGDGVMATHLTPTRGRLHSLLHNGSPAKKDAVLRPTPQGRDNRISRLDGDVFEEVELSPVPEQRRGMLAKASPAVKAKPSSVTPRNNQDKSKPPTPSRLRDRPLADLRPEDFKVNSKSNNGYKHAFDEVVRGKGDRAELAGCIDPQCCGKKFRAMAESELSAGGPGILSRMADTKMLEDYMGGEAYRLVAMTREERQATWLKAKTQDLADRYGRHRHRFARRPSPPGYWNPDFPSTQEIETRKAEAEKMERDMVEERWREAMRGGRWAFKDE